MLNIESDYLIFDNLETITFQNQGDSAVTIQNVMRRPAILQVESAGGGMVYAAAIEFLIWKEGTEDFLVDGQGNYITYDDDDASFIDVSSSTLIPRINALITDKFGKKYLVDSIDDGVLRSRWSIRATSYTGEGVN